jgi:RNA polymerase sigma factor (sigma-70 family)
VGESSNEELLKRCAEHDMDAWTELVERHRSLVWSVPLRLGMDRSDAAEIFQDVFESLIRNVESIQDPERLASWLYTAARRLSLRRLTAERWRREREDRDGTSLENLDAPGPQLTDAIVAAERSAELLSLVEAMAERCRQLLTALFLEPGEPDYDEIASRLGMPRGSIGPTRIRCLKKLHEAMIQAGYPFGPR